MNSRDPIKPLSGTDLPASRHAPEQSNIGAYPDEWVEQTRLRDGLQVTIRPIRPEDARRLQEGFSRLSPQSVFFRFLGSITQLSEAWAQRLTVIDYHDQMAFAATIGQGGDEYLIGVARYARVNAEQPGVVEAAVIVGERYQRRGLGLELLKRLIAYARTQGVALIVATVHSTNSQILRFVERSGFQIEQKLIEPWVWEIRMKL